MSSDPVTDLEKNSREELIALLNAESRSESAWTVLFHNAMADRLGLNATDHKCLDMIWRASEAGIESCMTPGQLARETKLTTGAVTGILDRLEHAGFVAREHDAADRRRIIVRPNPERIKRDIMPLFDWLAAEYARQCADYTDAELRLMIGFARKSQALLQRATNHLYTGDTATPGPSAGRNGEPGALNADAFLFALDRMYQSSRDEWRRTRRFGGVHEG